MNKTLEKYLTEKYPKILKDMYGDPKKTAMAWGISTDDGWFFLLDNLFSSIQGHIDGRNDWVEKYGEIYKQKIKDGIIPLSEPINPVTQVVAVQIKEKFGGLRFYYDGGNDVISGMVQYAENLSYRICERCGVMNEVVNTNVTGWIKTTCPCCVGEGKKEEHAKNRNKILCEVVEKADIERHNNDRS